MLPETRRDEVSGKAAGERLELVRKLAAQWHFPHGSTPVLMTVLEPGGLTAFELASAYKIWQSLLPDQRAAIERLTPERVQRDELFKRGTRLKPSIPRETLPDDFDEEKWIGRVLERLRRERPLLAGEVKAEEAGTDPASPFRRSMLRRRASSLYVREATGVRPVAEDRLFRFAASLPPWIRSMLDPLPPDEAARRLTFAYRLVFGDKEIGAASPAVRQGGPAKGQPGPITRPATPDRPRAKPAPPAEGATPF